MKRFCVSQGGYKDIFFEGLRTSRVSENEKPFERIFKLPNRIVTEQRNE